MKQFVMILLIYLMLPGYLIAQNIPGAFGISEIRWELDYQIFLKMTNDSGYNYDVRQLFHIPKHETGFETDYVYYPVNLGPEYINGVRYHGDSLGKASGYKTLWSALHEAVGGGWVHFTNCLLYALETGQLSLTAPLMQRIRTKWKPKPFTDSYLRTRKWKYYTPVRQKEAAKEYKLRTERNELGDLTSIPETFIELMLNTSERDYRKLAEKGEKNRAAKIDLVKLMMGSNFLGEVQINYIRSAVLRAVKNYSASKLPSVVIFDEFDAAAVMTLVPEGYQIDAVVFKNSSELTESEKKARTSKMIGIIAGINDYNQNSFIKRLDSYYQKQGIP
ncbi:MAG: hypothetical protein JW723_07535 [Bacteroidales bacterium]|nr:hypothetical protein [Bacteroidales bacterium]